jgi:hypothetical protein
MLQNLSEKVAPIVPRSSAILGWFVPRYRETLVALSKQLETFGQEDASVAPKIPDKP